MYEVSSAYLNAMKNTVQRHKLDLYLQNPMQGTVEARLGDDNIEAGSFEYVNQCSDQKDMILGSVYIGQVTFTIATFGVFNIFVRGQWVGGIVRPVFRMLVDEENDTWEDVPIGIFEIASATWSERGLKIVAYDIMSKFDKPLRNEVYLGIPFQIVSAICNSCGVEFGQEAYELQEYPNANEVLGLYPENGAKTYRDLLSWISAAVGGFATAGRDGKLYIRRFSEPSRYVDTIDTDHRYTGAQFSDYTTNYTRITDGADEEGNPYSWGSSGGVTIDLGGNPFIAYGSNVYIDRQHQAILSEVQKWNFTPFSSSMLGNPAYDLGDSLKFTGGLAGNNGCYVSICKQVWKYKKSYTVSGVGKNPKLSLADTSSKSVNRLEKQGKAATVRYFRSENIGEYSWMAEGIEHVADEKIVGFIDFVASGDNIIEYWAQVQLHAKTWTGALERARIITRAYMDDELMAEVIDTLEPPRVESGDIPFYETILASTTVEPKPHRVKLTVQILDCWYTPTWTDFTANIGGIRAVLKGQGLTTEKDWDGNLKFEDNISLETIKIVTPNITDTFGGITMLTPMPINLVDVGALDQDIGIKTEGLVEGDFALIKSLDPKWPICGDGFIMNNNELL